MPDMATQIIEAGRAQRLAVRKTLLAELQDALSEVTDDVLAADDSFELDVIHTCALALVMVDASNSAETPHAFIEVASTISIESAVEAKALLTGEKL